MFGRALNTTLEAFGNILNEKDKTAILGQFHCVKRVRIRSYSGPYLARMRENTDQNISEYRHFSRSV